MTNEIPPYDQTKIKVKLKSGGTTVVRFQNGAFLNCIGWCTPRAALGWASRSLKRNDFGRFDRWLIKSYDEAHDPVHNSSQVDRTL